MTVGFSVLQDTMDKAVEQCLHHVGAGGLPFVGVVVDSTGIRSEFGVNRVQEALDPTAHAEIVAMRDAMSRQARDDLTGSVLMATGEPCGLCYRFALDHGIVEIYSAVDRDAAAVWGFDYRGSYHAHGITNAVRAKSHRLLPSRFGDEPFHRYQQITTNSSE